jgi:hypothetical protein
VKTWLGERDISKIEQMTPAEYREFAAERQGRKIPTQDHAEAISDALASGKPVSSEAADAYGIEPPHEWVGKRGVGIPVYEHRGGLYAPRVTPAEAVSDPETFYQYAKSEIEREEGKKRSEVDLMELRIATAQTYAAVKRWQRAFDSIGWKTKFVDASGNREPSGGMQIYDAKELQLSLKDISKHVIEYENPENADHAVTEEVIHAVSEKLHREGKIDLDAIWAGVPDAVKAHVLTAYPQNKSRLQQSREFWRMLIQGHLNVEAGGKWSVDGKPIISEQAHPWLSAKIRGALTELFKFFSNMREKLLEDGAPKEYIDMVEKARDLTLERVKAVDNARRRS